MQAAPDINTSPAEAIVADLQTSYHVSNKVQVKPTKIPNQLHQVKWILQSIWKVFFNLITSRQSSLVMSSLKCCFNSSMDLREILLTKGSCRTGSHKVKFGANLDRYLVGPLTTHRTA